MIRVSIANKAVGLKGHIALPASKSISNRALLLAQLCNGEPALLTNLALCEDTKVMSEALSQQPPLQKDCVPADTLSPTPSAFDDGAATTAVTLPQTIDICGAGTAMRFLTAYYAQLQDADVILTGIERMRQRPIAPLVNALRSLGADISYTEKEGCPPLHIRGKRLHGDVITIDGSISSQYVSALLMIAPLTGAHEMVLTGRIVSRPYIEMTRGLMEHFGINTQWKDDHTLLIATGPYRPAPLDIEGDWSAASYWLGFKTLAQQQGIPFDITFDGLQQPSLQGDSVCADLLGDSISAELREDSICPSPINFTDCPDLVQTMAVAYCLLGRPYVFTGTESLRIKETDRIAALISELGKLGYELRYHDGILEWSGTLNTNANTPIIATWGDHRMAMAFAMAAMTRDSILIEHPEVVSKSYPAFWDDLQTVGFKIEPIETT